MPGAPLPTSFVEVISAQAATDCGAWIRKIERVREIEDFDSELRGHMRSPILVFLNTEKSISRVGGPWN